MPHLSLEEIARLVDELPEPHEATHLDTCDECRGELDAVRADSAGLASLPPIAPPAGEWPAIEARLTEEGLIRPAGRTMPGAFSWRTGLLRAAAIAAVFLAGALSGAAWFGPDSDGSIQTPAAAGGVPDDGVPDGALIVAREPRSAEEYAQMAREIEALYFNTLVSVSEARPLAETRDDPVARLAALEGIMTLTGAALDQAPADPVLNGYHLAAMAQREATLKQIASRTDESWF